MIKQNWSEHENKASDQMRIERVDHFHTVDSNPGSLLNLSMKEIG